MGNKTEKAVKECNVLFVLTFTKEYEGSDNYVATSCYLIPENYVLNVEDDINSALEEFEGKEVDHDDEFFDFFSEEKGYVCADNLDLTEETISRIHFGKAEG